MMSSELLRISDVASQAGVSVDTVRHYERKGVLQNVSRDDSGYRRYTARDDRLRNTKSGGFAHLLETIIQ